MAVAVTETYVTGWPRDQIQEEKEKMKAEGWRFVGRKKDGKDDVLIFEKEKIL